MLPRRSYYEVILSRGDLTWINAYFPMDPGTRIFDDHELTEVLNAIESILDTAQFDDVLFVSC